MAKKFKNKTVYNVMKFIMFAYNFDQDALKAAFASAAAAQNLHPEYFWNKFESYANQCNHYAELAILQTVTVMDTSSQEAFIQWVLDNYKGY